MKAATVGNEYTLGGLYTAKVESVHGRVEWLVYYRGIWTGVSYDSFKECAEYYALVS